MAIGNLQGIELENESKTSVTVGQRSNDVAELTIDPLVSETNIEYQKIRAEWKCSCLAEWRNNTQPKHENEAACRAFVFLSGRRRGHLEMLAWVVGAAISAIIVTIIYKLTFSGGVH